MHPLLTRHQTSQTVGAVPVECPRGVDLYKYATVEVCENFKMTVCHSDFTEKVYETDSVQRKNGDSHLRRSAVERTLFKERHSREAR